MSTPAIRALRRKFPAAAITAVGRDSACALVDGLPYVDRVFSIPHRPSIGVMRRKGRALRPHGRDVAVVLPHSLRAAMLAWT